MAISYDRQINIAIPTIDIQPFLKSTTRIELATSDKYTFLDRQIDIKLMTNDNCQFLKSTSDMGTPHQDPYST